MGYEKRTKKVRGSAWLMEALGAYFKDGYTAKESRNAYNIEWVPCGFMLGIKTVQCGLTGHRCGFYEKCNYEECSERVDMMRMLNSRNKAYIGGRGFFHEKDYTNFRGTPEQQDQ